MLRLQMLLFQLPLFTQHILGIRFMALNGRFSRSNQTAENWARHNIFDHEFLV